jgi:hypothetical protein
MASAGQVSHAKDWCHPRAIHAQTPLNVQQQHFIMYIAKASILRPGFSSKELYWNNETEALIPKNSTCHKVFVKESEKYFLYARYF